MEPWIIKINVGIRCFLKNRSGNRMSIDVGSRHNRTYIKIRPNKIKIHYCKSIFEKGRISKPS